MKNFKKLVCALALFGMVGAVQAGSVSLDPLSKSVTVGNSVFFDIYVDFDNDSTTGGTFQLTYDSSLLGISNIATDFAYNGTFLSSNGLTGTAPVLTSDGLIEGIGFSGTFAGANSKLGTITFSALNAGVAVIDADTDQVEDARFYNGSSNNGVEYGSAAANISAVPVPAAVWLMASGLLGMVGLSRRS